MENTLIFYQILLTNYLRLCKDISLENLFVDIGARPAVIGLICCGVPADPLR